MQHYRAIYIAYMAKWCKSRAIGILPILACCRCCPDLQKLSNVSKVRFLHGPSRSDMATELDPGLFCC